MDVNPVVEHRVHEREDSSSCTAVLPSPLETTIPPSQNSSVFQVTSDLPHNQIRKPQDLGTDMVEQVVETKSQNKRKRNRKKRRNGKIKQALNEPSASSVEKKEPDNISGIEKDHVEQKPGDFENLNSNQMKVNNKYISQETLWGKSKERRGRKYGQDGMLDKGKNYHGWMDRKSDVFEGSNVPEGEKMQMEHNRNQKFKTINESPDGHRLNTSMDRGWKFEHDNVWGKGNKSSGSMILEFEGSNRSTRMQKMKEADINTDIFVNHHGKTRKGKYNGRKSKRNEVRKYDPNDVWGNGKKFPDPIIRSSKVPFAVMHRRVQIPPLPEQYNIFANRELFYNAKPCRILTIEQEGEELIQKMRTMRRFEAGRIKVPRKLPVQVRMLSMTRKGTFILQLLDDKNVKEFEQLNFNIRFLFRYHKLFKWDLRIQKQDLEKGRLVLVEVEDNARWLRAKILDYNDFAIFLLAVDTEDYGRNFLSPHANVYYLDAQFTDCPFQLQEFHLAGLESLENTPISELCFERIMKCLTFEAHGMEKKVEWDNLGREIVDYKGIRNHNFILTKMMKIDNQNDKYRVELNLPDEVAQGVSFNELVKRVIKLDPLKSKSSIVFPDF